MKKTLNLKAGLLETSFRAVDEISDYKLPIALTVQIRNVRDDLRKYLLVFQEKWNALVKEYTDTGRLDIKDPAYPEWKTRAEGLAEEEIEAEVTCLSVELLSKYEVSISASTLDTLMQVGLIYSTELSSSEDSK